MCIFQGAYGKVLLHLILVQTGHYDRNEHTAKELFKKVLCRCPVVKNENAGVGTFTDDLHHTAEIKIQAQGHLPHDKGQRCDEKNGLQPVGPDNRLDAAFIAVQPDNQNDTDHCHHEGYAPGIKHQRLQNKGDKIKPRSRSHNFGEQEKPGARFI